MPSPILSVPIDTISGAGVTPQAPAQAFGANAAAVGLDKLGAANDQASNAMFQRAEQVQALNNQSAADSATGKYAQGLAEAGEQYKKNLSAELSANPQLNTEAYLGKFLAQQEGLRKDAAGTLDNPMATQMFNQDTRRLMIMSAQDLSRQTAATQKDAITKNATGAIQLNQGIIVGTGGNDNDPQAQAAVQAIKDRTHSQAVLWGLGADAEAGELQKNLSPAYETIFKAKVDSGDIDGAKSVLAAHTGDVTPEALGQMYGALKTANAQNSIKSPVSDIYDRGVAPTVPASSTVPGSATDAAAYYRSKGVPAPMAAALAAQEQAESGNQANPAGPNDGGAAYGAMQWHGDRQAAFQAMFGHPIQQSTLQEQRDFAVAELTTGRYKGVGQAAGAAQTPEEASDILTRRYTVPADQSPAALAVRSSAAREIASANTTPVTAAEAPPHFAPNADPSAMRTQLYSYNQRVALELYPNSAPMREQFLHDANPRADLEANATRDQQQALFDTAHGYLSGGLPSGNAVHSINDIPPTLLQGMSQPYKDKLEADINYATQGIGAYKTPEMTANAEMLTGMSGNAAVFENTDLSKYNLSAPDFLRLSSLQASLKRSDQQREQRTQAFSVLEANPAVHQIIASAFEQSGPGSDVRPTPTGAYVPSPQHMAFLGALKGEVDRTQGALPPGKTLSQEDIGTIARNLMVQRAGQTMADYRNIPPDIKNQINAQYQAQYGRNAYPDELTYLWHTRR